MKQAFQAIKDRGFEAYEARDDETAIIAFTKELGKDIDCMAKDIVVFHDHYEWRFCINEDAIFIKRFDTLSDILAFDEAIVSVLADKCTQPKSHTNNRKGDAK